MGVQPGTLAGKIFYGVREAPKKELESKSCGYIFITINWLSEGGSNDWPERAGSSSYPKPQNALRIAEFFGAVSEVSTLGWLPPGSCYNYVSLVDAESFFVLAV